MRHFFKIILLYGLLSPLDVSAQEHPPTGLLLEDEVYHQLPKIESTGEKYDQLPLQFSLKPYCPTPGFQGNVGSCVAWTIGYGALTISRAIQDQLTDQQLITQRAHSASFIYNQIKAKGDCQAGARFSDGLALLKNKGDCLAMTFQNSSNTCEKHPRRKEQQEAALFKIKNYTRLFNVDDPATVKTDETRRAIAMKYPVMIGLKITESFWAIQSGQTLWNPAQNEVVTGFHAMVVVAYDHRQQQFELMNSFGPTWGNQGFIKMGFEDFVRLVQYGFQMDLSADVVLQGDEFTPLENLFGKAVHAIEGMVEIRMPYQESGRLKFKNCPVALTSPENRYQPKTTVLAPLDHFQLKLKKMPTHHVYGFGFKANGEAVWLWSGNKHTTSTTEVILPDEASAFRVNLEGAAYYCFLYSQQPILDMESRWAAFQQTTEPFESRLQKIFGDLLATSKQIKYAQETMYFHAFLEQPRVISLVLKVGD